MQTSLISLKLMGLLRAVPSEDLPFRLTLVHLTESAS